jgi:hypothetical protein
VSAADDDAIRARLASMTVEELRRAVTTERDDYVPRALVLTEEELARRAAADPYRTGSSPVSPPRGAIGPTRWWHVWVAVMAAASVLNVIVSLICGFSWDIALRVCWALLIVPFALRLRRRERREVDDRSTEPRDGEDEGR